MKSACTKNYHRTPVAMDIKMTEKVEKAARDGAELGGGGGDGVVSLEGGGGGDGVEVPVEGGGGDAGDSLEEAETEMENFCPWLQCPSTAQKK